MALPNIIRRTASRVVPLAVRALGSQRYYHHHQCSTLSASSGGSLSRKLQLFRSSLPPALHHYSTKSDESLLRVIESEIQCAQETDDHDKVEEIPDGFPFKLEDNPGQQTVTLTRDYQGESIIVEVNMPDLVTGEGDDSADDDDDTETGTQSHIPLVVRVSKKSGPCLEFDVSAYPDEIAINSLSIKDPNNSEDQIAYEGPDFGDLDENLQKAFHKYLEIRGIKPSTTNFLHEYMINKDSKEYLMWLEKLKKYVEA